MAARPLAPGQNSLYLSVLRGRCPDGLLGDTLRPRLPLHCGTTVATGVVMVDEAPSLGQLIWLVRRELEWAHQVDAEHPLRFDVGSVELEAALEVTRGRTGGGGVDLTVMGVGAKGEMSRESSRGTTATVTVTLTPKDRRSASGKFEVSAVDVEPPRRASGPTAGEPPVRQSSGPAHSEPA